MKKPLVLCVVTTILFALTTQTSNAQTFLDTVNHPHQQQISLLQRKNIVQGYGFNIFRPDILINRAEFVKILLLARYGGTALQTTTTNCFVDFSAEPEWYYAYACQAKELGILQGYPDGTFKGNQTINLAEALKIIAETYQLPKPSASQGTLWYAPYFTLAANRNLFEYFPRNGAHLLTRSEMAYALVEMEVPILNPNTESAVMGDQEQSSSSSVPQVTEEYYDFFTPVCGDGQIQIGEECDDGNLSNEDTCSAFCLSTSEPVYQGFLTINSSDFASAGGPIGATAVPVYGFTASARRQAVVLDAADFTVQNAAAISRATLWVDTDQDFTVDTPVGKLTLQGTSLFAEDIAYTIPEDTAVYFEIKADISRSVTANFVQVNFASSPNIVAFGAQTSEQLTGTQLGASPCFVSTCFITVTDTNSVQVPIVQQGNVFIEAGNFNRSLQVVAGSVSSPLMQIKIRTDSEPVEIEQFSIESTFTNATYILRDVADTSVEYRLTKGACSVASSTKFCSSQVLTIDKQVEREFSIHADVPSDKNGGAIGEITLTIPANQVLNATGVDSQQKLTRNNADGTYSGEYFIGTTSANQANTSLQSVPHSVVFAKISSIANSGPTTDFIKAGKLVLAEILVRAAPNTNTNNGTNRVQLQTITFSVTAQNVQVFPDGFTLFNAANSSVQHSCTGDGTTGTLQVVCTNLQSTNGFVLESDASAQYILEAVVLNAAMNSSQASRLQASISNFGSPSVPGSVVFSDQEQTLTWIDTQVNQVEFTRFE